MWGQVAKIGLDVYATGMQAKAQYEADVANSKIAQLSRRISGNRETQAYLTNTSNLAQQATETNFNITKMAAEAQDSFDTAMAGSGISGASISEIKADITRTVAEDRLSVERSRLNQQDAMRNQLRQANENRVMEAASATTPDYNAGITSALFQSVGSQLAVTGDNPLRDGVGNLFKKTTP